MNLNNQSIEDFFKSEFENYQITPEPNVWTKIQNKITLKNFLKFNYSTFNIYYLAAILLFVSSLLFIDFPNHEIRTIAKPLFVNDNILFDSKNKLKSETKAEEKTITKNELVNSTELANDIKSEILTETNSTIDRTHSSTGENLETTKNLEKIDNVIEKKQHKSSNTLTSDSVLIKANRPEKNKTFNLNLSLSSTEGCVPLTIKCTVVSENAKNISIDLGNGISINNLNSNITYDKPGVYIIDVLAENLEGKMISTKDTVEVFPNPKAVVIIDVDSNCEQNCIAYFYNYSTGSVKYSWDFGDDNNSFVKDPVHIYSNTQLDNIKLKVWSDKMCKDSAMLKTPFNKNNSNKLIFPTAFMPSSVGSNNGYYSLSNYSSDIFYPISSNVKDYKLEIYSRNGVLLFQTRDINQGWDGYYKYELMPQNVYLWKVTGKYENGELIDMAGDVTLLRK